MSNHTQNSFRVFTPTQDRDLTGNEDGEMTEKTAIELRTLCAEKGEAFDASLTEMQARKRIASLREMD